MNYENMLTLKSRMGNYDAGSLLDIATGRGDFLKFALVSFRTWQSAAGIDIDPDQLHAAAKEFANSSVILILGSALSMPFTDHCFDTITMSNALHHIEALQSLFNETNRVCKSKGLIFINEMLNENLSDTQETYMQYHRFIANVDNQLGSYHREPYTLKELLALLKPDVFQILEYFIHSEVIGNAMNTVEIEAISGRLKSKVAQLRGTDYYYFFENKAEEIINRFNKTGIQRPRHVTFILRAL
jgi:ubiquinone/menaquinone biosynthesis C-methylase UbiE